MLFFFFLYTTIIKLFRDQLEVSTVPAGCMHIYCAFVDLSLRFVQKGGWCWGDLWGGDGIPASGI